LLKPKINEHIVKIQKFKSKTSTIPPNILQSLFGLDKMIEAPSQLTVENAITYADIINLFCHEYGITKITYFAGTAISKESDIYKI